MVAGIAEGCRQAGCALVGGETAEMPGLYAAGDYDLAGFCVGAAERGALLPAGAAPGDMVLGLASSGRAQQRLLAGAAGRRGERLGWDAPAPFAPEQALGEALLEPTRIYVAPVLALHRAGLLRAAAHITGGGLLGNLPRVLPEGTAAVLDAGAGRCRRVRVAGAHRRRRGRRDAARVQLRRRHGAGRPPTRPPATALLRRARRDARPDRADRGGERRGPTAIAPAERWLAVSRIGISVQRARQQHGALLDAAAAAGLSGPGSWSRVCNVADAPGLALARGARRQTALHRHRRFGATARRTSAAIDAALRERGVEMVCLAGYMRLLTPGSSTRWPARMLNIHPSLLPAFPGLDTHARALDAGVKLHGCTVHLVTEEVDAGPILAQAAVPVLPDDDEDAGGAGAGAGARAVSRGVALVPRAAARHADPDAALLNPLPARRGAPR